VSLKKRFYAIWSILLVLIVSFAVLGLGCPGGTTGTIYVEATLDGSPWTGAVEYTLTGPGAAAPTVINGHSVDDNFTGDAGSWNCTYVSGGPGVFVDITPPPPQTLAAGGNITFTLNFVTPVQVNAYVKFLTWSHNGTPIVPGGILWINKGDWIDAEYEEHVSGEEEGAVVTVHQTSWLAIHNTGVEDSGVGEPMSLHCVNHPDAVKMNPPAESKANQQCTVEGLPVDPCDTIVLEVCDTVNLDVEVDWELKICTNYTKTINWIGYPSPAEILYDMVGAVPFQTVTLVSYACVEVGEGFEDTNSDDDCCAPSSMLTIGFLP
jgi:hypothetical protein